MAMCVCVLCQDLFEAQRNDAKYCPKCQQAAQKSRQRKSYYKNHDMRLLRAREHAKGHPRPSQWEKVTYEPRTCTFCDKVFVPKRKDHVSCGKRNKAHRPNEKVSTVKAVCSLCGKQFDMQTGQYNRNLHEGRKMYCSRQCMGKGFMDRIILKCSECGKEFQRARSGVDANGKHYFCSKACQAVNLDYILRGEDHHYYINGDTCSKRGNGWKRTRKQVRERDGYTCQICGVSEFELGKALDVHHIKPYRLFDSYEEANKFDNLIALCPSCHHREELKE